MLHAGLDMHKRFSVVTVEDDRGREIVTGKRLPNDEAELTEFFGGFEDELKVVLEAGPNWYWMCDLLDGLGLDNKLCHPLKTKAIASARIKTDKIDSRTLAHLSRLDFIPESYKPDMETRHLRELLRYRAFIVSMRTKVKNRVHALLAKQNIDNPYTDLFGKKGLLFLRELPLPPVYSHALNSSLAILEALTMEIKEADSAVRDAYASSGDARLLSTIPGVGPIFSLTIASEIGDIDRFHSSRHLSSYAGLVPSTYQSGGTTRHGRITRQGSVWLRYALVEASVSAVARTGYLRDQYMKQKKRKGASTARVAVARKLSTYVYYMLKERKDFQAVVAYANGDLG